MTGRRGGRALVPAYLATGGVTRPGGEGLQRDSVLSPTALPPTAGADRGADTGAEAGADADAGAGAGADTGAGADAGDTGADTRTAGANTDDPGPVAPRSAADLPAAQLALLDALDGGPLTVAEAARQLDLPVSALRVLAAELLARELISARPPVPSAESSDPGLLKRVAEGLRALGR